MTLIQTIGTIIAAIVSLGVLIAGSGYGYAMFTQGRKKLKKDDVELFNEQLEALRKIIESQKDEFKAYQSKKEDELNVLREDLKKHTQEIGKLQGINEEKEKKIKELTSLLQNRDPALQEYMTFAREAITNFQNQMHDLLPAIKQIQGFVSSQRMSDLRVNKTEAEQN